MHFILVYENNLLLKLFFKPFVYSSQGLKAKKLKLLLLLILLVVLSSLRASLEARNFTKLLFKYCLHYEN